MARLYTDEHFPRESVLMLRTLGHDVLTVQEAAFAASIQRAVVTLNRHDFIKLHAK